MPLALGISFRALCIDFIQKLSLNSCRETTKAAQMAEKRNAKRKAKKNRTARTGKTGKRQQ